jgi:hypothetical protein
MAFGRVEHDAKLSLARAGARHEVRQRRIDPQTRIFQVDRIDRMLRDRHLDARLADDTLAAKADDARQAAARTSVDNAVEIDETDRLAFAVGMLDARTEPARHEREM